MYINNNQYDYCTCQRCPCCGKIVRHQPLTSHWGVSGGVGGSVLTGDIQCATNK